MSADGDCGGCCDVGGGSCARLCLCLYVCNHACMYVGGSYDIAVVIVGVVVIGVVCVHVRVYVSKCVCLRV